LCLRWIAETIKFSDDTDIDTGFVCEIEEPVLQKEAILPYIL